MAKKTYKDRDFKFETLQLHVGQESADPVTYLPDLFFRIPQFTACSRPFRFKRCR